MIFTLCTAEIKGKTSNHEHEKNKIVHNMCLLLERVKPRNSLLYKNNILYTLRICLLHIVFNYTENEVCYMSQDLSVHTSYQIPIPHRSQTYWLRKVTLYYYLRQTVHFCMIYILNLCIYSLYHLCLLPIPVPMNIPPPPTISDPFHIVQQAHQAKP